MNLTVPSFVEKIDLHDAIELAPAQAYLQKPTHYAETNTTNSIQFEDGGMTFSMEEYLSDRLRLRYPSYEIMYRLVMEVIGQRWPKLFQRKWRCQFLGGEISFLMQNNDKEMNYRTIKTKITCPFLNRLLFFKRFLRDLNSKSQNPKTLETYLIESLLDKGNSP
jgi:hypothetical protein